MGYRKAFTAIEMLVIVAVLAMLVSLLVPSISAARAHARRASCMTQMHNIHAAMSAYGLDNKSRQPPFAFSGIPGNLPLSGHWGGTPPGSAGNFGQTGVNYINLFALTIPKYLRSDGLLCPGADQAGGSYFPQTRQFSTYCLRFPYSQDLFADSPNLASLGNQLLGVYLMKGGGQRIAVGTGFQTVPLVRTDRVYRLSLDGSPTYDPAAGAIVSDAFLHQDFTQLAASSADNPVRRNWCHAKGFNVLYGQGAVKTVDDDGTVASNSIAPSSSLPDDQKNLATYAELVWQFFDHRQK